MGEELEGSLLEVEELLHLDVEGEGGAAGERGGAGDGEVGAAGEVGAQGLQVRAQVAHVQALTCIVTEGHDSEIKVRPRQVRKCVQLFQD